MRHQPDILVTGGAGFIGSHICESLLSRGHVIRVLDDLSCGKAENLPKHDNLEFVSGDIRKKQDCTKALDGVRHCIHLAGKVSVPYSIEHPEESANINILGFVTLLQAARNAGVERIIYASSAAVYGNPGPAPAIETQSLKPISPYGLEKLVMEQYADLFSSTCDFSTLGLRFFNVYGPRQDPLSPYSGVITKFMQRISASKPLIINGGGLQTRDFIHVSDVAELACDAVVGDACGVCNVGTGESISLLKLVDAIQANVRHNIHVVHEPDSAADIRQSCANTEHMTALLGSRTFITIEEGLISVLPPEASQHS